MFLRFSANRARAPSSKLGGRGHRRAALRLCEPRAPHRLPPTAPRSRRRPRPDRRRGPAHKPSRCRCRAATPHGFMCFTITAPGTPAKLSPPGPTSSWTSCQAASASSRFRYTCRARHGEQHRPTSSRVTPRLVLCGFLMGVLAVAQLAGSLEHHVQGRRQRVPGVAPGMLGLVQPGDDGGVVGGGVGEGGPRRPAAREIAHLTVPAQFVEHGAVVGQDGRRR